MSDGIKLIPVDPKQHYQALTEKLKVVTPKTVKAKPVKVKAKASTPIPEGKTTITISPTDSAIAQAHGHYLVTLPAELLAKLLQPVKGEGGWQSVTKALQAHMVAPKELDQPYMIVITPSLLDRIIPYATKFGSGGYQSTIRWILCLLLQQHQKKVLAAMWNAEPTPSTETESF